MSGSPRTYPAKSPKSPVGPGGLLGKGDFMQADGLSSSKTNTLSSQHRLAQQQQQQLTSVGPTTPCVMPVFPGRGSTGGNGISGAPAHLITHGGPTAAVAGAPYSPYSPSRFHIDKRCQHRCSWKCASIALIPLVLALTAMLAYFAAVSSMRSGIQGSGCIVVEDAKAVSLDEDPSRELTSSQVPTEESMPTSTATARGVGSVIGGTGPGGGTPGANGQLLGGEQWPILEMRELGRPYSSHIPPFSFWNSEFRNKQPAFIRFNFTLPWGANFAVYGRRNVAPSVTQYDFVEFIKGGRVDRLKRETHEDSSTFIARPVTFTTQKWHSTPQGDGVHVIAPPLIVHHDQLVPVEEPATTLVPDNLETRHRRSASPAGPSLLASTGAMVNVTLLQYLDTGRWFLSVYNDDSRPHEVSLAVVEAEGVSTACPNDCSGHGSCYLGKCDCIDGFEGADCSKSVCPVLCSNHGRYGGGMCHCEEGWKGAECDVPEHDCETPDCSGHGQCLGGVCVCHPGWKGNFCEQVDCADPTCSQHGSCVGGRCYCKAGWQGVNCSVMDQQVYQCLPGCSEHGSYDLESGACACDNFWTGLDCSEALCSLDCGPHGRCDKGRCECEPGWTGDRCDLLPCDARCADHGQCKNGTCVCSQGWNGRHCTLPGCKSACNRHGTCAIFEGEYRCECSDGWAGADCSIRLERECKDEVDNDEDGMVDCSDSECCSHVSCLDHIMCLASNDPVEVLLRKQPPSVTASFYQRVKFLIEENSVQSYAHMDEYSERRVAVIRGRVVTPQGLGIIGIRVSVDRDNRFGFTLTRAGGWFDVLVNGGGAVTLQFQRSPYRPTTSTVFVPWNQIVVIPSVEMQLTEDGQASTVYRARKGSKGNKSAPAVPTEPQPAALAQPAALPTRYSPPCAEHDHRLMRPVVVSTGMPEKVGGAPGRSRVFSETQILQECIPIPGSKVHLMYHSSQASGYLSTALMRLTHGHIPATLRLVHLRVVIEGSVYERTFEADPHLSYTFAWNKRNVYKQKVYGIATARISVGYEYSSCASVVWETQTVAMQGFDVDISDVGGWSLDIHHHYNFLEGILQKGDGSTLHFKQYPRTVGVVLGTGLQRNLKCGDECNGAAKDARLLTPVALASGPDGSLYVGDFNLVRRVTPDGNVYTVLQLSATQVSYQYYLSVSPADGHLYVSNPEKHQILRVLNLDSITDPSINFEAAVGSGERCIPGDETHCGDEGPAKEAKLAHPKGLAIAADKTMYIADGTNIRVVDTRGIIHTLVGHHGHHNHWKPIPCHGAIPAQQAQLQWPTGLALSPLDGSLYFIDDHLVLKLTDDLKIKVVAGTPLHCPLVRIEEGETENTNEEEATSTVLGSILSLAFSPTGDLYIAETDSRKVNAVRVIDPSGRISNFAGRQSSSSRCECPQKTAFFNTTCTCPNVVHAAASTSAPTTDATETMLSSNAQFDSISAMAVSPDGVLHVSDQGSLHILSLQHYLPSPDVNGDYQIPYPPTREIYAFNRYGQHIATRDLTSGKVKYTFLYSKNTSFGKLSTVTDGSGNKLLFLRDYSNVVSTIESTQDHKSDLRISGVGFLTKLQQGRTEIELEYDSITGLLTSKSDTKGNTFIYRYEAHGRLSDLILPTGETVSLGFRLLPDDGILVNVGRNGLEPAELRMRGPLQGLEIREGGSVSEARAFSNGSSWVRGGWGGVFRSEAGAHHPLLELAMPVEAQMLPMAGLQTLSLGDGLINTMECRYRIVGDAKGPQQKLERELWVNSSRVLAVEYDQAESRETYFDRDNVSLLAVHYDAAGLPLAWVPAPPGQPVNITYDRFNRLEGWSWGDQSERYSYERHGLLAEVKAADDGSTQYTYNDWNLVSRITMPSGRRFTFQYDEQGGLRHVNLPSETRHVFGAQQSFGFVRLSYMPPGNTRAYLQHLTHSGQLLQTVFPGDGARILYRYDDAGRLSEILHGDGRTQISYSHSGFPSEVVHSERDDFEYRRDMQYVRGLLSEERIDFGAKTGLSNAKFTYEYDVNLRLTSVQGRIGGQILPDFARAYSARTGAPELLGQFKLSQPKPNETSVFDGTALFSRQTDGRFRETQVSLTIHRMEVFRMEFRYGNNRRISQTRTYTRNVGVNTYTNTKNYTYDPDGQLRGVDAQEPWNFKYDDNGNMLSLVYRGNTIPMEYNTLDRIIKFGEGAYKYDNRGLVIQNARDEKFHYNTKGLLVRASKRGRFDVKYFYDHIDRLATRKDNYGNVTQFFYTNQERLHEVSHIYNPRDGKLMSLVYDDRGHLIFAQVYRHKYYVATDQCGTPVMVFNQYGEGIREIMRSPFGHIVYDSNPYIYLPIDFCGGLLDRETSLVHMPGSRGGVYDPLIGQWMTPRWEGVLDRVATPSHLHLYRLNGNDPINAGQADIVEPATARKLLSDHRLWLKLLGHDLRSLAPQLFPQEVTGFPASQSALLSSWPAPPVQPPLLAGSSWHATPPLHASAGFLSHLSEQRLQADSLSSLLHSAVKKDTWPGTAIRVTTADPPFGRGILVSRVGQLAVVSSVPASNNIYRDVFTSVFNQSLMLDFTFLVHSQDVFYFVKEDIWRAGEDHGQLKRLGGQVNITFHEKDSSTEVVGGGGGKVIDLKIHSATSIVNLRYGTTAAREKQRLLHHARGVAVRKAWHREKELLKSGFPGSIEWSATDAEDILQTGSASAYDGEYVHDVEKYPELAEDPFNVRFYKKSERSLSGRRKRTASSVVTSQSSSTWSPASSLRKCSTHWWLPWRHDAC